MSEQTYFTDAGLASEFRTDLTKWRLDVDNGRQVWTYLSDEDAEKRPQSFLEKYWLGLAVDMPELPHARRPSEAIKNGWEFFKRLQTDDGHWGGNYDGPLFVTCGLVIASYICGLTIGENQKREMCRYLLNRANADGGWGLHTEGKSSVFGTAMNYTMLRILGMDADHAAL
ncbi:hypothetical protein EC988_003539, partial [Linderina pennispora]